MKSPAFDYARVGSLAEACELLALYGDGAKLIAGGQSLVPMMAMRLMRPTWLIDINEIAALKFATIEKEFARIGAATRQCVIERDEALAARVPLLRQALHWVGHVQTRNRGTVGGSLAHADPSAELPLVAQTLGARMTLRSGSGARTLDAIEFFTGPMMTAARADECLEEIHWPVWNEKRSGSAFAEIGIRHGDFAIAAAAAQVSLGDDGRCVRAALGLGGVGQTPLAFPKIAARLIGVKPDDKLIDEITHDAAKESEPGGDLHASADYRRHLAQVLAVRAIRAAIENAKSVK